MIILQVHYGVSPSLSVHVLWLATDHPFVAEAVRRLQPSPGVLLQHTKNEILEVAGQFLEG